MVGKVHSDALEARMRALLEATTDAILMTDSECVITDANRNLLALCGCTEAEAVGKKCYDLFAAQRPFQSSHNQARLHEIAHSSDQVAEELETPDGRTIELTSQVQRMDGEVIGRVWGFRDITDRKSAEQARFRLAAIVDSSNDAVVSKNLDGIVITWNTGAERVFGYSADEMVGQSITKLIPSDRLEEERDILSRIRRGDLVDHYETIRVRKDGTLVPVALTVSPVRDNQGAIIGASKIARDITERRLSDERLSRSEAELRILADSIPQLAWMAHPGGELFWCNQGWIDYTGVTLEKLKIEGWHSVVAEDVLPHVNGAWKASLEQYKAFEMEFPIRSADGKFQWFLTRANPLRDHDGTITRWFGTSTNVEKVKQMEAALREESETLELLNATGKVVNSTLDVQELLQSVTDAATKLTGAEFGAFFYNTTDEKGDAFMLYTLSGASREAFEKFGHPRATPLFGPTFRGEAPIRLDDVTKDSRYGQWAPHQGMPPGHLPVRSYLAVPVTSRTGQVIGGLFFGHSRVGVFSEGIERIVTGIAAQAAVAIDNARLYEGVKKSAEQREALLGAERAARSEAERLGVMKDEFLATLSHELRTPLSAILGWAQVLSSRSVSQEDIEQGLDAIQRNARVQTQLIEDLLDMSRIVSGKVRLDVQWCDLANVVDSAVNSVRPTAEAKGIRLRKIIDPHAGPVSGDPTRLQQVVWNLLTNAIKFTPKGGKVDVLLERVNSHLEITVHDSGAGIEPEFLPYVFERFRQADSSTTRSHGGLGLGLSIVKNLVELHGGTVRVKSGGKDQGSTFTVGLPLAPVRQGEHREHPRSGLHPPVRQQRIDLNGIKVLIVDDEPDARTIITRVLSDCGALVIAASSADEAMALLTTERPHIVVSDIGMPNKNGYEFISEVRDLVGDPISRIPAIALTAFARSEDRTRAMMAGYQIHISKPIEPQELIATVGSLVGRTGRPAG